MNIDRVPDDQLSQLLERARLSQYTDQEALKLANQNRIDQERRDKEAKFKNLYKSSLVVKEQQRVHLQERVERGLIPVERLMIRDRLEQIRQKDWHSSGEIYPITDMRTPLHVGIYTTGGWYGRDSGSGETKHYSTGGESIEAYGYELRHRILDVPNEFATVNGNDLSDMRGSGTSIAVLYLPSATKKTGEMYIAADGANRQFRRFDWWSGDTPFISWDSQVTHESGKSVEIDKHLDNPNLIQTLTQSDLKWPIRFRINSDSDATSLALLELALRIIVKVAETPDEIESSLKERKLPYSYWSDESYAWFLNYRNYLKSLSI